MVAVRVLLGWLLRVSCEFEVLPDELLVVILLPILDVMLELMRPLELSTGRLTVLRVDELDFDELGRVVSCRPSVLELGAVGVLTDDELVEGRRMLKELVDREVDGRETIDREIVDREVMDREVVGLDIVDREVVDREVDGREIVDREVDGRLDELRLVVTLLVGRLEVLRLEELRLDVTVLELLDDVDLDDDLAEEEDFDEDELFRLVLLDVAITGSAISARISTKSTKNRGLKEKDRFPASNFRILYSVFFFSVSIVRLLSSAFTSKLLFHLPIKGKRQLPGNKISAKYRFFSLFSAFFRFFLRPEPVYLYSVSCILNFYCFPFDFCLALQYHLSKGEMHQRTQNILESPCSHTASKQSYPGFAHSTPREIRILRCICILELVV